MNIKREPEESSFDELESYSLNDINANPEWNSKDDNSLFDDGIVIQEIASEANGYYGVETPEETAKIIEWIKGREAS